MENTTDKNAVINEDKEPLMSIDPTLKIQEEGLPKANKVPINKEFPNSTKQIKSVKIPKKVKKVLVVKKQGSEVSDLTANKKQSCTTNNSSIDLNISKVPSLKSMNCKLGLKVAIPSPTTKKNEKNLSNIGNTLKFESFLEKMNDNSVVQESVSDNKVFTEFFKNADPKMVKNNLKTQDSKNLMKENSYENTFSKEKISQYSFAAQSTKSLFQPISPMVVNSLPETPITNSNTYIYNHYNMPSFTNCSNVQTYFNGNGGELVDNGLFSNNQFKHNSLSKFGDSNLFSWTSQKSDFTFNL